MCVACCVLLGWRSQRFLTPLAEGIKMNEFVVYVGGYACNWSPVFVSRKSAEAWVNEIGERGGWDERVEVLYEGDTAHTQCRECLQYATCDFIEFEDGDEAWLCRDCQPQPAEGILMEGQILALADDANSALRRLNDPAFTVSDAQEAFAVWKDLNHAVYYLGYKLGKLVDEEAEPARLAN
jgi:hypothetical protein